MHVINILTFAGIQIGQNSTNLNYFEKYNLTYRAKAIWPREINHLCTHNINRNAYLITLLKPFEKLILRQMIAIIILFCYNDVSMLLALFSS